MKCTLIISSLPDIIFIHADKAFIKHINKLSCKAGFIGEDHNEDEMDMTALSQIFSPMITSLTYMNDLGNPYSSILCEDGTLFVFSQFDDLVFAAVNGDGEESEEFLKRKLSVIYKLATLHYGASLELLKPEIVSAQKKAWKTLGSLIDTWGFLSSQQQSFLVEAVERLHVNLDLSEMSIGVLDTALSMARNRGDQNAVHALLLVNTKLLALYSSRNASELKAADILLITVLLHNIFPHSKQAIPLTLNRTPPPLAHQVIRKGGPSVSHRILGGPLTPGASSAHGQSSSTPVHSNPVDIDSPSQKAKAEDVGYPGSSVEEEFFYSPRSSPTPSDGRESTAQELPKTPSTPKEYFFTPRADTPDYLKQMLEDEEAEETDEEELEAASESLSTDSRHEYYRQPVFLSSDRCPYLPHVLHFVRLATGTVLVLVSETKQCNVAQFIYQALQSLASIKPSNKQSQRTVQQAQAIMERLETTLKKVLDSMRTTVGVAVENQVRTLRHRWELVKRGNLLSFLAAPAGVEMTPQLESSVSEMTRSLKSLFSVLFCTSRGEPSISQQLLVTISQIKEMLQTRLADCEDYLLVKGQRNVTMTAYPFHGLQRSFYHVKSLHNPCTDFPGLVHFIYVDRSSDQVTAPSINTTPSKIRDSCDPCYVIKQKIWDMWTYIHSYLLLGHTFVAVRDGDFLFTYCLWFEDASGNPVQPHCPLPVLLGSPPPGILSSPFYKDLTRRCFPTAPVNAIRCYELMCVHVGLVPVQFATKHIRRLASALFETSLGAHYPISLIQ
ncbi:hybrid polyketide synthetase [Desmophyllum pertusum]|uniref:Hybrid polyketide synthetase n=1 Tax=Desmophyllum pertusum TaxID=174260 RepID=A0A9X0A3K6_9CNID|nr:hybrid polyketide synthetase [Desmophyllum pertusum]